MPNIDQDQALQIVVNNIDKGKPSYHQDYDRVNSLADLYTKLITGENVDSLLQRYNPRETKEQFEQRKRITQLVTPAVTEKIKSPFNKVARIDNVKTAIVYNEEKEDANNDKVKEIEKAMDQFNGDNSLDDFMEDDYIAQSFLDPNSFIIVEIGDFNPEEQKAEPFPIIVDSKDAINYKYKNNRLQWLVVKKDVMLRTRKGNKASVEVRIYAPDFIIKVREVEDTRNTFEEIGLAGSELIPGETRFVTIKKKAYMVEIFDPKTEGQIQATGIGYKKDAVTKGRTYINPFHKALARMMKSIKSTSELDLTIALQTFPRTAQYVPKCQGKSNDTCNKGQARNGKCEVCNGTGWDITKSSQEMLTLPMPRDKEDMLDLNQLVSIKTIPVDLPKFMNEYLIQLENQAMQDVFVSESFNRITQTKTATEKELDMESVYDTLLPFANKYSAVWKKLVIMTATFIDNGPGLTVTHSFPKDFKLKTSNALIDDRQKAMTAQVPAYLLQEIDNDLAVKLYADNHQALREYQVKQQHIPFKGKSDAQIQIAINMNLTPAFDKILWSNYDAIFGELDAAALNKGEDFYSYSYDKRVGLIAAKVDEYILKIAGQQVVASLFPTETIAVEGEEEDEDSRTPEEIAADEEAAAEAAAAEEEEPAE